MSLNYDTVQALINKKYVPVLYDNIFKKDHYVTALLKRKAKTYDDREIVTPLEYANMSNAQFTAPYQTFNLQPGDPITAAVWQPKMITDTLTISLEEELVMNSEMAVKNILDTKMKNVQKGLEKFFATNFWARSLVTNGWSPLEVLVYPGLTGTVGGIDSSANSWWRANYLDASLLSGCDATIEADLIDPTKASYIMRLLQRGVALSKRLTGANPNVITVPQYIFDLIEFILDKQKAGNKYSDRAGSMGFTALDFRGIDIVADDDSTAAQTGDTDGRMEFLNLDYLYMFFNSKAKFKASEFVKPANQNAKSCTINAYGNLVTTNRAAHAVVTNFYSPKSWAGLDAAA